MDFNRLIKALHFSRFFWGVCSILLILNIVFYAVFIKNQRNKIEEMQETYSAKRGSTLHKGGAANATQNAREALAMFKDKLAPKAAFAEKFKRLNELLEKHGLPVSGMSLSPANQPEGPLQLWKYTASFTVTGPYGQLKRLLADIQNLKDLFCIESLSLENRSKDRPDVEMRLEVASYFK